MVVIPLRALGKVNYRSVFGTLMDKGGKIMFCGEKDNAVDKVVEVKKPFKVYYSVNYYAPIAGGNEIDVEPGTRFRIKSLWGEDAYECSTEDPEFGKAAENAD